MQFDNPANAEVFFAGRPVCVARGMAEPDARALQRKLSEIGMVVAVQTDAQATKNTTKSTAKRRRKQNARKRKRALTPQQRSNTPPTKAQDTVSDIARNAPPKAKNTAAAHGKGQSQNTRSTRKQKQTTTAQSPKLSSPFAPKNTYALTPYRITPAIRRRASFSRIGAVAASLLITALLTLITFTLFTPMPQAPNWGIEALAPGPHDQVLVLANNELALFQNGELRLQTTPQSLGLKEIGKQWLFESADSVLISAISAENTSNPPWQVMRCTLQKEHCQPISAIPSSSKTYKLARNALSGTTSIANTVTNTLFLLNEQDQVIAKSRAQVHPNAQISLSDGLLHLTHPAQKTLSILRPDASAFGQRLEKLSLPAKPEEQAMTLSRCNWHWWALLQNTDNDSQRLIKLDDQLRVKRQQTVEKVHKLTCFNDLVLLIRPEQRHIDVLNKDGELLPPMTFTHLSEQFDQHQQAFLKATTIRQRVKHWSFSGLLLGALTLLLSLASLKRYHTIPASGAAPVEMIPPKAYWLGAASYRQKVLTRMLILYCIGALATVALCVTLWPSARFAVFALLAAVGIALWWYRDSGSGNAGMYRNTVVLISPYQRYHICKTEQLLRWGPFIMAQDVVVFLGHPYLPNLRRDQFNATRRKALGRIPKTDLTTVILRLLWSLHPLGIALLLIAGATIIAPLLWP